MKKRLSVIFVVALVLVDVLSIGVLPFNAETIDYEKIDFELAGVESNEKQYRAIPVNTTQYRWKVWSKTTKTGEEAYKPCAEAKKKITITCQKTYERESSVSGNAGVCSSKDCLINAGMTITSTKSRSISQTATWTPGNKGGIIFSTVKYKDVTTKYRKQKRTCSTGKGCGSWTNMDTYKSVRTKGDHYVAFKTSNY